MDMRQEALRQAKNAFAEGGREEIFFAVEVINEVLEYAKKEGLLALAKDEFFRQKGEPYILDAIEKKGKTVPLKKYLAYGLDRVSYGDDLEMLDAFLENRYYANDYAGKDTFIAYIYLIGITAVAQGLSFEQILECFKSFIIDEEEDAFDEFAAKWESKVDKKKMKTTGRVIQFGMDKK